MRFDIYWSRLDKGYVVKYNRLNGATFRDDLRHGRPIHVKVVEVASEAQYAGMSRKGLSIPKVKLTAKSILLYSVMGSGTSSNMDGRMFNAMESSQVPRTPSLSCTVFDLYFCSSLDLKFYISSSLCRVCLVFSMNTNACRVLFELSLNFSHYADMFSRL